MVAVQTVIFFHFQVYELMGDSKDLYKVKSEDGAILKKVEKAFQVSLLYDTLQYKYLKPQLHMVWTVLHDRKYTVIICRSWT